MAGVKHGGTRRLHDLPVGLLLKWLRRAEITHMGGVGGLKKNGKGLFTEFANQLRELDPNNPDHATDLRYRLRIIPVSWLTPRR